MLELENNQKKLIGILGKSKLDELVSFDDKLRF